MKEEHKHLKIIHNETLSNWQRIRFVLIFSLMSATTFVTIGIAAPTFFKLKNVYRFFLRIGIRLSLKIYGITLRIHQPENMVKTQCIYISNHRSFLDFFFVGALGLPNARYFISDVNERFLAARLLGYCVGIFFIPKQHLPEGRTACYQAAEKKLRETGDSVFLTPEGHKQPRDKLEAFNKGPFHLATNLRVPISPFYIHVPKSVNVGKGFHARKGTVDIYFLKTVDTSSWELSTLTKNITAVHEVFKKFEAGVENPAA